MAFGIRQQDMATINNNNTETDDKKLQKIRTKLLPADNKIATTSSSSSSENNNNNMNNDEQSQLSKIETTTTPPTQIETTTTTNEEMNKKEMDDVVIEMATVFHNLSPEKQQNELHPAHNNNNNILLTENEKKYLNNLGKDPKIVNEIVMLQNYYRAKKAKQLADAIRENKMLIFENEIKKHSPLRQTLFYAIFLFIYSLAVFLRVDGEAMYFSRAVHEHVVEEEFLMEDASVLKTFDDVANEEEFWQYLSGPFAANVGVLITSYIYIYPLFLIIIIII